jgi:hypothetical protein
LAQLVQNALDAGSNNVKIAVETDAADTAIAVSVEDDGEGISPERMDTAFAAVGDHLESEPTTRDVIGTKGIGRFSQFRLGYRSEWETVSNTITGRIRQRWTMSRDQPVPDGIEFAGSDLAPTGTKVRIWLTQGDASLQSLFRSTPTLKRELFLAFASYLARYGNVVSLWVNGEPVTIEEYVLEREVETVNETAELPGAVIRHFLMENRVQLEHTNTLLFSSRGATVITERFESDGVPNRKYLGVVDSDYLATLTSTSKGDFVTWDERFNSLRAEATSRAARYVESKRGDRARSFIEQARAESFYPYRAPPTSPIDRYSQSLYDNMLIVIEENAKISVLPSQQKRLVFALIHRLLRGEDDLAAVLIDVLGLEGEEVRNFAAILRNTSLRSMIATSSLVVDRLSFLRDLETIVYGYPSKHVKERSQLQKIIEGHTWMFGEAYNLMTADQRVATLVDEFVKKFGTDDQLEPEYRIDVPPDLMLVPDLCLVRSKKVEGPDYFQHLIVEMKAPKVRIAPRHLDQLRSYARAIVEHPVFGEIGDRHRFQFVIVSSEIAERVKKEHYLAGEPSGLIGKPVLKHPTELWAIPWSHYLDDRRSELDFLQKHVELTADPEALDYLRRRVPEFLPQAQAT